MEKHGDGEERHHAIRVPLTAATPGMEEDSSSDPDLVLDTNVSLLHRASKLISSSATAYRGRPPSFWALLALSAGAMLTAFPASSLLSRVYYDAGGQSKWILSWSAVAGWPIPALLLPPCYLLLEGASPTWPPPPGLCLWYALLGLLSAADNLMYAWAYAYLPASTASLVAASSLAFSAVFGRLIVKKNNRMGLATVNAIVVITAGVVIVALDSGSDRYPGITDGQYAVGFALDVLGSALHGLIFALSELAFATHLAAAAGSNDGASSSSSSSRFFHVVLEQQVAVSLCAFAFTSAGLAVFGEGFGAMGQEAAGFAGGEGAYAIVLGWSAATFQVGVLGATGVVYLGSTVLAGVLNAVRVPVTSVAAVIWFHDPMSGFKILSLVITVWGFGSYMVGHSGADKKPSRDRSRSGRQTMS
ncbi:probable purine permease 5 [Lolium rigidum]|uniref:probable purine permease 5 n=1 Tax=Lolium rigidum TaxID=89674 RepID=UPI001F5DDF45|nr:probable purine permease 5 [Lolium rigidum]